MTYNVFGGTLNLALSIYLGLCFSINHYRTHEALACARINDADEGISRGSCQTQGAAILSVTGCIECGFLPLNCAYVYLPLTHRSRY